MGKIEILRQDITKLHTDCIVNAANKYLTPGNGVSEAIFQAAGYSVMYEACMRIGRCQVGESVTTPGFDLNAKHVIHTATPVWNGGTSGETAALRKCYDSAFREARRLGCTSIALPLLATGCNGFPAEVSWQEAISSALTEGKDLDVTFAVLDQTIYLAGTELKQKIMNEEVLFNRIDREVLKNAIEILCTTRKIQWIYPESKEPGVYIMGYPDYPDGLYETLFLLDTDREYRHHFDAFPHDLLPTEMSVSQIQTLLTYIGRAERFCDGVLAEYVEDGTLLKVLLRLDDLMNRRENIHRHW